MTKRTSEKQKLDKAVDEFTALMRARLHEKRCNESFQGWNNPVRAENILERLNSKVRHIYIVDSIPEAKTFIDIANFAMMLHGLCEKAKRENAR